MNASCWNPLNYKELAAARSATFNPWPDAVKLSIAGGVK
jgi:hypothetical protein